MLRRAREGLTYSNVVATIALFGMLAGDVAVAGLKKNSVGKKQLKTGAVITKKIAATAVTTDKLADGAVTTPKLGESAVTGAKVDESTLGTVPAALQATNAANATNAENAVNAQNATAAGTAANAQALGGKPLSAVRSAATGVAEETNVGLLDTPTTVAQQTDLGSRRWWHRDRVRQPQRVQLLRGGRDQDPLRPGVGTRRDVHLDGPVEHFVPRALAGDALDVQIPLVGIDDAVPAGVQTVRARCQESVPTDLAFFSQGTLVLEEHPTG